MEKRETKDLRVISASRRTDLVGCHPEFLAKRLEEYPPESVHSVVLWTKNPRNMIEEGPLRKTLGNYRQLFVHLTITGMGGGEFEPHIPAWEETVGMIGPLGDLVGDRRRICWRFDPILEVEGHGKTFSTFDLFPRLADPIAAHGIETCRVSWVSPYKKVTARLLKWGWHLVDARSPAAETPGGSAGADRSRPRYEGLFLLHGGVSRFPLHRRGETERDTPRRPYLLAEEGQGTTAALRLYGEPGHRVVLPSMQSRLSVLLCQAVKTSAECECQC